MPRKSGTTSNPYGNSMQTLESSKVHKPRPPGAWDRRRWVVGPDHARILSVYKPNGTVQGYMALRRDGLPLYVRETVDQAQDDLRRMLMGEAHERGES